MTKERYRFEFHMPNGMRITGYGDSMAMILLLISGYDGSNVEL